MCCSTAVILERRYFINYTTYTLALIFKSFVRKCAFLPPSWFLKKKLDLKKKKKHKIILFHLVFHNRTLLISPQVALRDLQMRGMPSNLLPGEPLCSPRITVLVESTVQLLRRLHQCDQWAPYINQYIHSHLELIGPLLKEDDLENVNQGQAPD